MYIDAYHDSRKDIVNVVERNEDGKRCYKQYPIDFTFYYEKKGGQYTSIYGQQCEKFTAGSKKSFQKELKKFRQTGMTFESDIKAPFKIFEQFYKNVTVPNLHVAFFDIEVDFDKERGFAPTEDPFNPITAVSVYNNWEDVCYTFVVAPKTYNETDAENICNKFDNTILCPDEKTLLLCFLKIIDDADVLTGWNSEGYDIPYIVGRLIRVLGRDYARKMCLWDQMPKSRTYERYGKEEITYDLIGRLHLDYLQLYRKYTYSELPSYSLDYVGEHEVNEKKVAYKGSLDDLYNYDFEKFIEYNRQDTMLMVKIDDKMKLISLTNVLAHENCVLLQTTMGAVALSDQAIILEAHERGFLIPDRDRSIKDSEDKSRIDLSQFAKTLISSNEVAECYTMKNLYEIEEMISKLDTTIAGAYVADPTVGRSKWVGSVDITSLYPSIMMALNISPETIVGQVDQTSTKHMLLHKMMQTKTAGFAQAWNGVFTAIEADYIFEKTQDKVKLTFDYAGKTIDKQEITGQQAAQFIHNTENHFCMSANGTIFRHDIEGIIPGLLARWFVERKELQGKAKGLGETLFSDQKPEGSAYDKLKEEYEFWDQRQLIKKIQLNSLYGAVTNPGSRFFDQRMGQSITLTGREIARHMAGTINEILTGVKDHLGECIVYGDTDSAYYSAWPIHEHLEKNGFEFTEDNVVELYDSIAVEMNKSFKRYMIDRYNCEPTRAERIKANREICGTAGLFVKKKRYAINVYDDEGKRPEGGKLKIMGMDTQRADTPEFVQKFLKDVLRKVLTNDEENDIISYIADFREEFQVKKPWELGTPKRCNGLTRYTDMENKTPNSRLPGHIRAAYNWNNLKRMFGDNQSQSIGDGGKTIVCKLKKNQFGITSCAYPIDESNLPDWFTSLPFDVDLMEETLIDKKLDNLIGVLGFDLEKSKRNEILDELFSFGD